MPNQSATKRIEQAAHRWAKENTSKNSEQRKRFVREMRRAYLELPLELRGTVELALYVAERRGQEDEPEATACEAHIWHGPGHQSSTRCRKRGPHDTHEAVYGGDRTLARWRDGSYTDKLREKGIDFDPESYPENMAMTGFFDEPPEDPAEEASHAS